MVKKDICVGIFALQGAYAKHKEKCNLLGVSSLYIRSQGELEQCSHLIIPGGESTTISKLMKLYELVDELKKFGKEKYIWGTCAGMILLANDVDDSNLSFR